MSGSSTGRFQMLHLRTAHIASLESFNCRCLIPTSWKRLLGPTKQMGHHAHIPTSILWGSLTLISMEKSNPKDTGSSALLLSSSRVRLRCRRHRLGKAWVFQSSPLPQDTTKDAHAAEPGVVPF